MKALQDLKKTTKNSLGYIDIYERSKEFFKAEGVFRICKGRWKIGITSDNP